MIKHAVLFLLIGATMSVPSAAWAEVTMGGSVEVRSRMFDNLDLDSAADDNTRITQERIRVDITGRSGAVRGKIQVENDWDTWGRMGAPQANEQTAPEYTAPTDTQNGRLHLREAWIDFRFPGTDMNVKAGHQVVQLGQGWFLRSTKYGADAWLITHVTPKNLLGFLNVKGAEGSDVVSDDVDVYTLFNSYKISDLQTVGIDITSLQDRDGLTAFGSGTKANIRNLGLNYTGALGALTLKAALDIQRGRHDKAGLMNAGEDADIAGNQAVLQTTYAVDTVTYHFGLARGSGYNGSRNHREIVTFLDQDQHYTLIYEYLLRTAAGDKHTGFSNTKAINVGIGFKTADSVSMGFDLWHLTATERVILGNASSGSRDIGFEIDARLNWRLYENLTWNWTAGYFLPGDAYKPTDGEKADSALALQGVLGLKF